MCLITAKKSYKIAKEDIPVWKCTDGKGLSAYQYFKYEHNTLYCQPLEFITKETYKPKDLPAADKIASSFLENELDWDYTGPYQKHLTYIRKGFHSYATLDRAMGGKIWWQTIEEFIIPRGARYVKDETDIIVSNRIIRKRHE